MFSLKGFFLVKKPINIEERIQDFDDYIQSIEIWTDPFIWKIKNEDCYSKWLLKEFSHLESLVKEFVKEGYFKQRSYSIDHKILRNLAYYISKGENFIDALSKANGHKGKIGLELAIAKAKVFYKTYNNLPRSNSEGMERYMNVIVRGQWKSYGISSWNEFIVSIFGEDTIKHCKESEIKQKLDKAVSILANIYKNHKRLPKITTDNEKVGWIHNSCRAREWKGFGINSWNDLLIYVFGEINVNHNKYIGAKGFQRAISEIQDYYKTYRKKPKSKDFRSIVNTIYKGHWLRYGISKWNDLLKFLFKEVNLKQGEISKKYSGKNGLLQFQIKLRAFKNITGSLPKANDKEMGSISSAIYRGIWKDQGIKTWNDLLRATFGEVNCEPNKFIGLKGLEKAKNILKGFERVNKRIPNNQDKGMGGIISAINRGEWFALNIKTWNDLLFNTFGEINHNVKKYKGRTGFERAIYILEEFKRINKRIPTLADKEMGGIEQAIRRGEWLAFGIKKWNDLLNYVFKSINQQPNKHTGIEGLKNATMELIEFRNEKKRLPTSDDKKGIASACRRDHWVVFGIKSWNDLLEVTFGAVNCDRNKFIGRDGLERAVNDLKDFERLKKRLPKGTDKKMGGIKNAIQRGEWLAFGIKTWNDLLTFVFKKVNRERKGKKKKLAPSYTQL